MTNRPLADFRYAITNGGPDELSEFLRQTFPDDKNSLVFGDLARFVCGITSAFPATVIADVRDAHFVSLMKNTLANGALDIGESTRRVIRIGPELDFLEHTCTPNLLSAVQVCSLAMQCRRIPRKKVAVVVMARDEGIYLPEWLAHYRLIGAEHVFVYTNDNADGSEIFLRELARAGSITLIEHDTTQGVNPQRKVYQHAILLLSELRDYKWALFVDADEFLNFQTDEPGALPAFIDGLERDFGENLPGAVVFPWNWRLTDRSFSRGELNVLRHYPHAELRRAVKPLVNLKDTLAMCQVHIPTLDENSFFLDGQMRQIVGKAVWNGVELPYHGPVIEHFWAKSFVEFLIKKRKGDDLALNEGQFRRDYFQFFQWTHLWSDNNHNPISNGWIEQVETSADEILSDPALTEAYRLIVERYRGHLAGVAEDRELNQIFSDLLQSIKPGF